MYRNATKSSSKIFLQQAGAFGSNTGKDSQKPHPKLTNMYIICLPKIFALPAIHCKW